MEGLLSYIIMFIVISLVLLLIVYNITTSTITFDSYNIFTSEVISPLFILFILGVNEKYGRLVKESPYGLSIIIRCVYLWVHSSLYPS